MSITKTAPYCAQLLHETGTKIFATHCEKRRMVNGRVHIGYRGETHDAAIHDARPEVVLYAAEGTSPCDETAARRLLHLQWKFADAPFPFARRLLHFLETGSNKSAI